MTNADLIAKLLTLPPDALVSDTVEDANNFRTLSLSNDDLKVLYSARLNFILIRTKRKIVDL
jgi:hypothetical protein